MRIRFLWLFLLAVVSFFTSAAVIHAAVPVNGKIVFVSDRDGNNEIYTMNGDGSAQTRLTNNSGMDYMPVWSPDGKTIAFCRWDPKITGNISYWLMDQDGLNQRQITNYCDGRLAWSPNGQQLAFSTWWGGVGIIWRDGTTVEVLDPGFGFEGTWDVAWSSDGSRFAFTGVGGGAYSNIFSINRDGSNLTQVTRGYPYTSTTSPDWSPNGNELVFADASQDISDNDSITLSNPDGTNLRRILTSPDIVNYSPSWSPDGANIVFSRRSLPFNSNSRLQIWSMARNGSGLWRLTDTTYNNFSPDWQRVPTSRAPFDYDGDGRTDLSVYRPSEGNWYVMKSGGGIDVTNLENTGVIQLVPADYDGDGKTDRAMYAERQGILNQYTVFLILMSSTNTVSETEWGWLDQVPVPADYSGDQTAEIATFKQGVWNRRESRSYAWGLPGDKPAPADFNGDGAADMTVFRPSNGRWYTLNSGDASISVNEWGLNGDIPIPADYSGDGKADFCVFRPSNQTWYRRDTDTNQIHVITWGMPGDLPVPGDYDGDGRNDLAVFRPSNSTWYIFGSTSGIYSQPFGLPGDKPTPNAFVY